MVDGGPDDGHILADHGRLNVRNNTADFYNVTGTLGDAAAGLMQGGDFLYGTRFWGGQSSVIYLPQSRVIQTVSTGSDTALFQNIEPDITRGIAEESDQVGRSLEVTETLHKATSDVARDGSEAAVTSQRATEIAEEHRETIATAIERLVAAKGVVGERAGQKRVDLLAALLRGEEIRALEEDRVELLPANEALQIDLARFDGSEILELLVRHRERGTEPDRPLAAGQREHMLIVAQQGEDLPAGVPIGQIEGDQQSATSNVRKQVGVLGGDFVERGEEAVGLRAGLLDEPNPLDDLEDSAGPHHVDEPAPPRGVYPSRHGHAVVAPPVPPPPRPEPPSRRTS